MITLATLKDATAQQVFDQVARHLLTQNERSNLEDRSACAYRGDGGLKCAAGCLIADSEYLHEMDHCGQTSWGCLIDKKVVPRDHRDLITDLQWVHDSRPATAWRRELRNVAVNYKLSTAVPDEFASAA